MVFRDLDKIYTIVIHPLYFTLSFAFFFLMDNWNCSFENVFSKVTRPGLLGVFIAQLIPKKCIVIMKKKKLQGADRSKRVTSFTQSKILPISIPVRVIYRSGRKLTRLI